MSKVLITGGTGFVGGRLAKRLAADHEVCVSSRKPGTDEALSRLYGNVVSVKHDSLFAAESFPAVDTVVHLAALNELDSVKLPSEAIRVNIDETRIILENSIARGVGRFVYFSTAHIYGAPLVGPISEATVPQPGHPYAITHRAAEDYVCAASRQGRVHGIVVRLSNSFGAPVSADVKRWTLLANDLCRQAVERGKMVLNSNGCQYRDFVCLTDVEEVVAGMVAGTHPLRHSIYNLGSGSAVRVIDMARRIEALCCPVLGGQVPIELPPQAQESVEPGLQFSIERLVEDGFHVKNDVTLELERLLRFCAAHFSP